MRAKKGFTLIELIISLLILSLISITLLTMFKSGSLVYKKTISEADTIYNLRIASDFIEDRLEGCTILDVKVVDKTVSDEVIVRGDYFKVKSGRLYVAYDYNEGHPYFNPLADCIKRLNINMQGNTIKIKIEGSLPDNNKKLTSITVATYLRSY